MCMLLVFNNKNPTPLYSSRVVISTNAYIEWPAVGNTSTDATDWRVMPLCNGSVSGCALNALPYLFITSLHISWFHAV
jgi:hypothetical protein